MSDDTRTFKLAKMKDMSVIYPHPVKKGEKYLIQPNHNLGDTELQLLVSALNEGYLSTQKDHSSYYRNMGTHTDGQTPVYELMIEQLHFNFLNNKESDLKKGEAIEKILSKKLIALIIADTPDDRLEALNDFKKRLEAQKKGNSIQKSWKIEYERWAKKNIYDRLRPPLWWFFLTF